jgi:hypothetical protein
MPWSNLFEESWMDDFHKVIDAMLLTVTEFESAWQHLLEKYNLHGDAFLTQIYDLDIDGQNPTSKRNSVANRLVCKKERP